jgi:hypothetical protein
MLKAIHACESRATAEATAQRVRATLEDMKLSKLGDWVTTTVAETLLRQILLSVGGQITKRSQQAVAAMLFR